MIFRVFPLKEGSARSHPELLTARSHPDRRYTEKLGPADAWMEILIFLLHSSSSKRIVSVDKVRVSVIMSEFNHITLLLMTASNTLTPRGKLDMLVRCCTKPSTDGLAKESHFRAADARYASESLIGMQKNRRLELPFVDPLQSCM